MRLLFVCMGNICRSPAAEGIMLQLLGEHGLLERVTVDSAGTGGWHAGQPADRRMQAAAERRGVHLPSRARQVVPEDLDRFDRILAMDSDNLAALSALQRRHGGGAIVEPMLRYSGRGGSLDVPDPYYGGDQGFELVLDLLEEACEGLLHQVLLRGDD
ncbi:low molecular weight phosphotyrosine protein phosphatase [Synechococcus sp. RSCCF101]|uniref:low molecular weight protein-tyrosine-phosphatase n=1 Tax=Synechococcus sp. RSCCF101 TaxID=2511069 RepID=UPI0012491A91|nr:low molecular weight protein-tyrosine-phosphatase [Synechococcus sp. RSCCF101]QEY32140.1 low molecular weight phosphotyrosine protein phosphatase [Synechococcus sp. RSCCF101]